MPAIVISFWGPPLIPILVLQKVAASVLVCRRRHIGSPSNSMAQHLSGLRIFYQRVSRISASVSEQRLSDLKQVRGGRVLNESDSDVKAAHLRLATEDIPVWVDLSYARFDGSDDYSYGQTFDFDSSDCQAIRHRVFYHR